MNALYTAKATATGGREGNVKSADGALDIEVKPPKEMGGPSGTNLNPEILFAGGYAACFGSALNGTARMEKASITASSVTAEVSIGKLDNGGYGLAVVLDVNITGVDQAKAEALVARAHQICPYSNAIRHNVDVKLNVTGSVS